METLRSLNAHELKVLAKIDGWLAWGRWRYGLFVSAVGFVGGLSAGGLITLLIAIPGDKPTVIPAVILLSGIAFGGLFAALGFGAFWHNLVQQHADLAYRGCAFGQFKPRFASPLLRRSKIEPQA